MLGRKFLLRLLLLLPSAPQVLLLHQATGRRTLRDFAVLDQEFIVLQFYLVELVAHLQFLFFQLNLHV